MRGSWVWRDGELVEKHLAGPPHPRGERGSFPLPMLNRDYLDRPLKSMADGKVYESKSAMRRGYKERGFVELGNDAPTSYEASSEPDTSSDVVKAYEMVRDGYKPPPLEAAVKDGDSWDVTPEEGRGRES